MSRRGSYHVHVTLPDGQIVTADHRDKIVPIIRRYYQSVSAADQDAIRQWWAANAIASENCRNGRCDHVA
ncbi:MAG TPA: hypothetical protein VEV45_20685 [Streptosporangiaceae bacterium]|nr:hypothetical protein [Streptosporangiaceae bacterium]